MYERRIDDYVFKGYDDGNVSVYRHGAFVTSFFLIGVDSQKRFDEEITYWYFDNRDTLALS